MKPSRSLAWLLAAGGAVAVAGAAWLLRPDVSSAAAEAKAAPLVRTVRFSARIAAQSRVEAGSTITGRVEKVHVREGDRVEQGQLLVTLDGDEASAALAQARAGEQQAQARIAAVERTSTAVAQAQLRQAQATADNAAAELRRAEELVRQGFISASRLDESRRALQVALAQADALRAQLDSLDRQGSERAQAVAQWHAARAATAAAQARYVQTRLLAPAGAKVLARLAEPGQIVQPGKALIALALDGPTLVVAEVDERFLGELRVGQSAAAVPDAHPAERLRAEVVAIAPIVDAQKGAIEVKLAFRQALPAFLREDMTVSVEVVTASRDRAIVVPAAAVRRDAEGRERVLVLQDTRAVARPVRTGLRTADGVEVTHGVAAGDQVLLDARVHDGDRVRVVAGGAAAAGPGATGQGDGGALGSMMGGARP